MSVLTGVYLSLCQGWAVMLTGVTIRQGCPCDRGTIQAGMWLLFSSGEREILGGTGIVVRFSIRRHIPASAYVPG